MRVTITDRVKVWEINDKEGVAEVKFSTSRPVKENNSYDKIQIDNGVAKNGYIADYRSFVRFVGHAYNQLKSINIGDTITNLKADMSLEPYWDSKNKCIAYPKNEKITVFEFEMYTGENNNGTKNLDKAPQVAEEPKPVQYTAPMAKPNEPVVPSATAEEECPF